MSLEEAIGVIIEMDQANTIQMVPHLPISEGHRYFDAMRELTIWYYEQGEHRARENGKGVEKGS